MSKETWQAEFDALVKGLKGEPGVTPVETARALSGLEFLRRIVAGELPRPPINDAMNFYLTEIERGRAVFTGQPTASFYNPIGTIHAGWASTLLDSCMACAVHSSVAAGQGYTTLEIKVNFVRAISHETGPLRAEGRVVNAGSRVSTAEGRLTGPDGRLYAHGTTTCLILTL